MTHRFAPKLTKEHVDVTGFKTMSVKLAAQVFSQFVTSVLCYMSALKELKPDATFTADFCATMNDLFDSSMARLLDMTGYCYQKSLKRLGKHSLIL